MIKKLNTFYFLLAICCLWDLSAIQPVNAYTFNGYELRDLNDDATFAADASQWTASRQRTTNIYSTCGTTLLLGGYGVLGISSNQDNDYFQRIYTGLPTHSMIHFTITFWAIDSWDYGHSDSFFIKFDSVTMTGWTMDLSWFRNQICGVSPPAADWKEADNIRIFGTVTHSGTSLTLQVITHLNEPSDNESFGFRDVVLVFDQSGTTGTGFCGSASSVNLPGSVCACPEGQYNNGGTCSNCDGNCASCYGGTNARCYQCKTSGGVFWDGTKCITCATGCSICTGTLATQCIKCASGYAYFAWINQCVWDCLYPLVRSTDGNGVEVCTSPCGYNEYIYWDKSCSANCAAPLQQKSLLGVVKLCRYPCSPVEYLYWDGACLQDCWGPLTVRVEKGVQYCDYKCNSIEYLYWNGTCASTCQTPLISRIQNGMQFCHPPCASSFYLYPDNTCIDNCTGYWTPRTTGGVQYCDFKCSATEFLYWNGTCLGTCDFPLRQRIEHNQAYCDYPTDTTQFLYWDGTTTATCSSPLSPRSEGTPTRKFCDYDCSIWDYMYWDGSCVDNCDFPLTLRIQNGRRFCDFSCSNANDYLYWNGSCETGCTSPFNPQDKYGKHFCYSPTPASSSSVNSAASDSFYYWDGSSSTDCPSPFTQRIETTTKYCDFPCTASNPSASLYWNGSCIVGCLSPLKSGTLKGKPICEYPCTATQYLHTNGSCLTMCDSPYIKKVYGSDRFCFDACTSLSDYYYWNNTCLPTCPAPLQHQQIANLNWCVYPCLANQFLLNDGSCLENCESPLRARIEAGYKYCSNPCSSSEFLFWNGTCISSCQSPLRKMSGRLCVLPCDDQLDYYDEQTGECKKKCDSPSLNSDDMFLRCLAPKIIIDNGSLLDIFLKAPEPGTLSLVTVPSGLQYIRYLNINMPSRLFNFTASYGRSVLSLRFGQRMSNDMQSMFVKRALAEDINYQVTSSFIINFWEEITSLTIMVTVAMFLTISEQIFKTREWTTLQNIFEKLKVIARWNFCLVLLGTSVGNIIFYSSLEFKNAQVNHSSSVLSLEFSIIMIIVVIALLIAITYLVHQLQLAKRQSVIYNSRQQFESFQAKWQGCQILFRGFRNNTFLNKHFYMTYLIRIMLSMIVASALVVVPIAQTILFVLINLCVLIFIMHQQPLIRKINHIQLVIVEILSLVINCALLGLTILSNSKSDNNHLISVFGDLIIGTNSCINLVAIVFLFLKLIDGASTIYKYQKTQKERDLTMYLQLLVFVVQQGGFGFEEMFVSEEVAKIFNQPNKLIFIENNENQNEKQLLLKSQARSVLGKGLDVKTDTRLNNISKFFSMFKGKKSQQIQEGRLNNKIKNDSSRNSLLKLQQMTHVRVGQKIESSKHSKSSFVPDNSDITVPKKLSN